MLNLPVCSRRHPTWRIQIQLAYRHGSPIPHLVRPFFTDRISFFLHFINYVLGLLAPISFRKSRMHASSVPSVRLTLLRVVDTAHWWLEAQTHTDRANTGVPLPPDEKIRVRSRLKYLRGRLDSRCHIYWKRLEESGPYLPCLPGEEYSLWPEYSAVVHEPRVGNTTFKLWLPVDKEEFELASAKLPNPSLPKMPTPPTPPVPIHLRYPSRPPPDSVGRIPGADEIIYTGYVRWSRSVIILASNTHWFPPPPPTSPVSVHEDGYWGLYEYTLIPQEFDRHAPWLVYMPIDEVRLRLGLRHTFRDRFWSSLVRGVKQGPDGTKVQHTTNLQTLKPELRDDLFGLCYRLCSRARSLCTVVLSIRTHLNRDVNNDDLPLDLLDRTLAVMGRIDTGVLGWNLFLLSVRHLIRSALELEAFISWAEDVRIYPRPRAWETRAIRGAIFEERDYDFFLAFRAMNLPVYLRLENQPLPLPDLIQYPVSTPRCDVDGPAVYQFG